MSLSAMTWALEAEIPRPTAKLALVCLCDHANEEGYCFPSQKELAKRVGVSERSVRDALAWLEDSGFITRSSRHRKDGSRTSDAYQLPEEAYRKNFPHPRKKTQSQPEESAGLTTFEPPTEPIPSLRSGVDQALDAYSEMAERTGLPKPRVVNEQRRRKIAATLNAYSLDLWFEAVAAVEASAFCQGQNDRGWQASLDFLLQRKSFDGLIEGKYANKQPCASPPRTRPRSVQDAAHDLMTRMTDANRSSQDRQTDQPLALSFSAYGQR